MAKTIDDFMPLKYYYELKYSCSQIRKTRHGLNFDFTAIKCNVLILLVFLLTRDIY